MPETSVQIESDVAPAANRDDRAEFVRALNVSLHELTQPMTVLLCTLDFSGSLESVAEMKEMLTVSREACERLRKTVVSMQALVRGDMERVAAKERAVGSGAVGSTRIVGPATRHKDNVFASRAK